MRILKNKVQNWLCGCFGETHLPDTLMHKKRTGFTLMELLTVMAIMSILAAILLPALGRARAAARYARWRAGIRASNRVDPACLLFFTFERETFDILGEEVKNLAYGFTGRGHCPHALDGTKWGDPQIVEGRFPGKTALEFDGGDWVEISHSTAFDAPSITVEGWFKLNNTGGRHILITNWFGYSLEVAANGQPYFRLQGITPRDAFSTRAITWGRWHHIVATFNNTTNRVNIFIDGANTGTAAVSGNIIYDQAGGGNRGIRIGWTGILTGLVGEVAIFDRVLDADEIRARFEGSRP